MNARRGQFVKPYRALGVKLLSLAAGCILLGACAGNPFADAKIDPRSPVAGDVARLVRPDAPYPTFAAIPPVPKDIRPPRQFGQAAAGPDAEPGKAADTEAFAAALRKRATPPPPAKH